MAVGRVVRGDKPLSGEFDLGRISRQAGSAVNDYALVKSKTCFKLRAIRGYTHGEKKNQKPRRKEGIFKLLTTINNMIASTNDD